MLDLVKRYLCKKNKTDFVLTFAGDTSLGDYYMNHRGYEKTLNRLENEPMSFFDNVIPLVNKSSYFVLNLETVLADNPSSPLEGRKKYLGWDNPNRTIAVLKNLGVNAVSLANNHSMDFGPDRLLETREHLTEAGIEPFGAGESLSEASKPLKITFKGKYSRKKIYVFGVMYVKWKKRFREEFQYFATKDSTGINILGKERLIRRISRLKEKDPDALIILFAHWQGFDYEWADDNKISICNELINNGVDFFIGHGSHTMQQFYTINQGTVICSIGNFVFNSKGGYKKMKAPPYSFIVRLEIEEQNKGWVIKTKLYPIFSNNRLQDFRPRPVTENEIQEIISMLDEHALGAIQTSNRLRYNQNELGFYLFVGKDKAKEEKND